MRKDIPEKKKADNLCEDCGVRMQTKLGRDGKPNSGHTENKLCPGSRFDFSTLWVDDDDKGGLRDDPETAGNTIQPSLPPGRSETMEQDAPASINDPANPVHAFHPGFPSENSLTSQMELNSRAGLVTSSIPMSVPSSAHEHFDLSVNVPSDTSIELIPSDTSVEIPSGTGDGTESVTSQPSGLRLFGPLDPEGVIWYEYESGQYVTL